MDGERGHDERSSSRSADLVPRIELHRDGDDGQAHGLAVSADRIRLSAAGPAGLRYAAETLVQLADARGRVPCCDIEDAPNHPRRGVMLDVSRGKVPTLETLKGIVDLCVRHDRHAMVGEQRQRLHLGPGRRVAQTPAPAPPGAGRGRGRAAPRPGS